MKPVSMKLPKAKQAETAQVSPRKQEYPWGLSLNLENESLEKLGIEHLPDVGTECTLRGVGKIVRVSQSASENDKNSRMIEIQITKLALEHDNSKTSDDFKRGYKRVKERY